jgi:hypothetical protein
MKELKELNLTGFDFETPEIDNRPRSYMVASCMFSDDPAYAEQAKKLGELVEAEKIYMAVLKERFKDAKPNAISVCSEPKQVGWTATGEAVLVVVEGAIGKFSHNAKPQANGHWWVARSNAEGFEELKADITQAMAGRQRELNERFGASDE